MRVTGGKDHWGHLSHKYYLTKTELSILPALLYLILTITLRALLVIPSFSNVETGSEWLNNLLMGTQIAV